MEKGRKGIFVLLPVLLLLGMWCCLPGSAQASAEKSGLKKEGGYYYYYVGGQRVTNTWKTVRVSSNGGTVSYRYYFGKTGKAYAAPDLKKSQGYTKNIVVKKIGNYSYGFDRYGRMVKSGYYNDPNKYNSNGDAMTYYFDAKGRCIPSKSKAIRRAGAYKADAGGIRQILGQPLKTKKLDSCYGEPGADYKLVYSTVYVAIHRYPDKSEFVFGIFPR